MWWPSSKLDELELDSSFHQPWLEDRMPEDFTQPLPTIERFLFEDVYQLPIATSRRHEIWAGAQMKASERLQKIIDVLGGASPSDIFAQIYRQLYTNWQHVENVCTDNQLPLPNCALWANEILSVRKDFYHLTRSRFRHFVKTVERSNCNKEIKENTINTTFDTFEMFWMLPGQALRFIRERGQELKGTCPTLDEFDSWLENCQDLTHDLKILQKQGLTARNNLVNGYLRSALRFARNYVEKEDDLDYLDLVQEGAIGLIKAADKFDYRASGRFITYATSWMWQAIGRAISDFSRNIRIPVHRQEEFIQLENAYQACLENQIELPTAEILCLHLEYLDHKEVDKIRQHLNIGTKLSPRIKERWDKATKKTQELLEYIEPTLSLSVELSNFMIDDNLSQESEKSHSLFEIIYDQHNRTIEDEIADQSLREVINELLEQLPPRNQKIMILRFGLADGQELTLEEIGKQFGLTRERVRQIEAGTIKNFRSPVLKRRLKEYWPLRTAKTLSLPGEIIDYLRKNHSYWSKFNLSKLEMEQDWQWLDKLIKELPGSHWNQFRDGDSRQTQLQAALKTLKSPAHYTDITEQLNDILEAEKLEERYVYNLLNNNEEVFILLGEGVFSLNEWERKPSFEPEPLLSFCSLPLPDLPGQTDTFLESVLVANDYLKQGPRTSDFLRYMLQWSRGETSVSNWLKQSILNAYYLVGLIPYTFHFEGEDPILHSTLPPLDLPELRRYCLQKLTERLMAMPEFWWTIRQYEPGTSSDFAEYFAVVHPFELNDVTNRLRLLTGLGAVQRLPYSRYRLTSFGASLVTEWAREPDFGESEINVETESDDEEDFSVLDLGLW